MGVEKSRLASSFLLSDWLLSLTRASKSAMTLLENMKETFSANIPIRNMHQVKFKQPWMAEIGLYEQSHPIQKKILMGISPHPTKDQ